MLVEMALVRLGRLDDLVSLAQLAQWLAARPGSAAAARTPCAAARRRLAAAGGRKKKAPDGRR